MNPGNNRSSYAPVIVRIAMSLVFLWFGINQLSAAGNWIGLVPGWVANLLGGAVTVVRLNGWFEVVAGICLLVGFQLRIVALLLGLHLLGIASSLGFSAIGVRDFGLTLATFSICFAGPDRVAVDSCLDNQNIQYPDKV